MWREAYGLAQATNGPGIVLLREGDSGQFGGKSWIVRREATAGFERGLRFVQAAEMRK